MLGIKNRQEDQTKSASDSEEDGKDCTRLIKKAFVRDELPGMSKPSLRQNGQVEKDDSNHTAGDKQRLSTLRADIRDVSVESKSAV